MINFFSSNVDIVSYQYFVFVLLQFSSFSEYFFSSFQIELKVKLP